MYRVNIVAFMIAMYTYSCIHCSCSRKGVINNERIRCERGLDQCDPFNRYTMCVCFARVHKFVFRIDAANIDGYVESASAVAIN